jgi:hypothetical protein
VPVLRACRARLVFGDRLAQPVERDGEQRDRHPRLEAGPDGQAPQGGEHVVAEAAGADHRGDDDHVERQHDHLVDPDHEAVAGRRQQHLPQHLARGAPGHAAELGDLGGHRTQRQDGHPHHRRHGVDHGGDHRRDRPEAEQEQDGHQIGEDRHRLHQVEDRRDRGFEARPAEGDDAERPARDDTQRHRDEDRRQRHHGAVPLAEDDEVAEGAGDQDHQLAVADPPGEENDGREHARPGDRRQGKARLTPRYLDAVRQQMQAGLERHVEHPGEGAGEFPEGEQTERGIAHQPAHGVADPVAQRKDPFVRVSDEPGDVAGDVPEQAEDAQHQRRPTAASARVARLA